jgi:hypothetical protein
VRFHPGADRDVRLVDEFKPADQSLEAGEQFIFAEAGGVRQPLLVLE